jgi:RimJ/RimL family protein N-acetyltransferase
MDLSGYTARTERMLLRPYADDDFEAFLDLHRREDVARYLPWTPRDEPAARAALERHRDPRIEKDDDGATLAAVDPGSGRLLGEFVLFLRSREHQRAEIGYVLHPDVAGRGLATEGARHLLTLAFEGLTVHRVVARIDARNAASARVLTKLGMRHEAHFVHHERFKGEWGDEDHFGLLREEWERSAGPRPAP